MMEQAINISNIPSIPKVSTILTNQERGNHKINDPNFESNKTRTPHELAALGEIVGIAAEDVDKPDSKNWTPLFWAAFHNQLSCVEYLVESGANVNHKALNGATALMFAASRGNCQVVKTLLRKGAKINDTDNNNNTALMFAAYNNRSHVVEALLDAGAVLTIENNSNQNAYEISIARENTESIKVIEQFLLSILPPYLLPE